MSLSNVFAVTPTVTTWQSPLVSSKCVGFKYVEFVERALTAHNVSSDVGGAQVYQERIAEVHQEMEQLREGIHPDYLLGSTVLLNEKKERIRQAARCKE